MTKHKITRAVASVVATGAILMYSLVPTVFADTTLQISGNGSGSSNAANVTTSQETTVVQNNSANISNNVDTKTQTGNNQANDNTNGNVSVNTGSASSTVNVSNTANSNKADVSNCGTCNGNTAVTISGNGSESKNSADLTKTNTTSVFQDNRANIDNRIKAETETGDNTASRNTGGDVAVTTGSATTHVTVENAANANVASVGGSGKGGTLSAVISGNGSGSDNDIDLTHTKSTTIVQDNNAHFRNNIDAEAETGENYANDNTNGSVAIHTGNARTTVGIDNMANFNAADVSCCLTDVLAKISGNGSNSENEISAELGNSLEVFQGGRESGNWADFHNYVDPETETGDNYSNRNTGPVRGDDQSIMTGSATEHVTIHNASNENLFGPGAAHLELPNGLSLSLSFDLTDLLRFLHIG